MSTYINSGMDKPLPAEEKASLKKNDVAKTKNIFYFERVLKI
jgi:hypothetical protein